MLNVILTDNAFFEDTISADRNIREVLHIVVDKLNKLLVYSHITFMWSCTKLVQCDYLTQIKLFDLVSKYTLDTIGADQNIR